MNISHVLLAAMASLSLVACDERPEQPKVAPTYGGGVKLTAQELEWQRQNNVEGMLVWEACRHDSKVYNNTRVRLGERPIFNSNNPKETWRYQIEHSIALIEQESTRNQSEPNACTRASIAGRLGEVRRYAELMLDITDREDQANN